MSKPYLCLSASGMWLPCACRADADNPMQTGGNCHHFSPVEWELADGIDLRSRTTAFVEALNRADLH
jgi:hypothetical protein